jgi:hypothetical protein
MGTRYREKSKRKMKTRKAEEEGGWEEEGGEETRQKEARLAYLAIPPHRPDRNRNLAINNC